MAKSSCCEHCGAEVDEDGFALRMGEEDAEEAAETQPPEKPSQGFSDRDFSRAVAERKGR